MKPESKGTLILAAIDNIKNKTVKDKNVLILNFSLCFTCKNESLHPSKL